MTKHGYVPLPTITSEREGFPSCPKDSDLPKCANCSQLIYHGDCPLGRSSTSHVETTVTKYSNLMNGSGSDEDLKPHEVQIWVDEGLIGVIQKPDADPESKFKHGTGMTNSESYHKSMRKKSQQAKA